MRTNVEIINIFFKATSVLFPLKNINATTGETIEIYLRIIALKSEVKSQELEEASGKQVEQLLSVEEVKLFSSLLE